MRETRPQFLFLNNLGEEFQIRHTLTDALMECNQSEWMRRAELYKVTFDLNHAPTRGYKCTCFSLSLQGAS